MTRALYSTSLKLCMSATDATDWREKIRTSSFKFKIRSCTRAWFISIRFLEKKYSQIYSNRYHICKNIYSAHEVIFCPWMIVRSVFSCTIQHCASVNIHTLANLTIPTETKRRCILILTTYIEKMLFFAYYPLYLMNMSNVVWEGCIAVIWTNLWRNSSKVQIG